MVTHSSSLAWRTSMTEEPGGLQSTGSQRVGHDRVTRHSTAQHKDDQLRGKPISLSQKRRAAGLCKHLSASTRVSRWGVWKANPRHLH